MKKLISLAAALAVAAGAAALPAGAAMENVVQSRIWNEEIEMFDAKRHSIFGRIDQQVVKA